MWEESKHPRDNDGKFTEKGSGTTATSEKLTDKNKTFLKDYTNGHYGFACSYSQFLLFGGEDRSKYSVGFHEQDVGVDALKEQTQQIVDIIQSQPVQELDLYRVEASHWTDMMSYEVGATVQWGIRSTSRSAEFVELALKGLDRGVDLSRQYSPTVFHIKGKTQSFDISDYSDYEQQESLTLGSFRVVKNEQKFWYSDDTYEQRKAKFEELKKDVPKALKEMGVEFTPFVSKAGNKMVKIGDKVIAESAFLRGEGIVQRYLTKASNYSPFEYVEQKQIRIIELEQIYD